MSERQRAAIESAVREVLAGTVDGDGICTITALNAEGEDVWVQLIEGSLNTQYPLAEDPMKQLTALDVFGTLPMTMIEWEAGSFACFECGGIAASDIAFVIDRLFVRLLKCNDAGYEPASSVE